MPKQVVVDAGREFSGELEGTECMDIVRNDMLKALTTYHAGQLGCVIDPDWAEVQMSLSDHKRRRKRGTGRSRELAKQRPQLQRRCLCIAPQEPQPFLVHK